ncbi:MAG: hypothetical protein GY838_03450 [bacterium]|nr:hypothetical protein [bacterium]
MSVEAVSSSSIYSKYFGESETTAPKVPLTPQQKLAQERLEVEQLEFLAKGLGKLRRALDTLRDEWRSESRMSAPRSRDLAGAMRDAFTVINEIVTYHVPGGGEPAKYLTGARNGLLTSLAQADQADLGNLAKTLGLDLDPDLEDDEERIGKPLPDNRGLEKKLSRAIRHRYRDAEQLIFGIAGKEGLLGQLEIRHSAIIKSLAKTAEYRGVSLDAYA